MSEAGGGGREGGVSWGEKGGSFEEHKGEWIFTVKRPIFANALRTTRGTKVNLRHTAHTEREFGSTGDGKQARREAGAAGFVMDRLVSPVRLELVFGRAKDRR